MDHSVLASSQLFRGIPAGELRYVLASSAHHIQCYEKEEIVFSTSSGMERKISFSSCGLSAVSDFYQRCALATLTARQAQLEFAKASPGVTTGVEQNDCTTEVSVIRR